MRLSEIIVKRKIAKFSSAIPLLLHIYVDSHNWNADDFIGEVYKRKQKYIIDKILIFNIENKKVSGKVEYKYIYDDGYDGPICDDYTGHPIEELDLENSSVNLVDLINLIIKDLKDISHIPNELLIAAGIEPPIKNITDSGGKVDPGSAAELGALRLEKIKWDKSIDAATKVGLLFYEQGLEKQSTKEAFMKEFVDHLEDLPGSTIERIYKALPPGYKQLGGRPKKSNGTDGGNVVSDAAIKAAVYAGSIFDTTDAKDLIELRKALSEAKYVVPSDEILNKIITAVENI